MRNIFGDFAVVEGNTAALREQAGSIGARIGQRDGRLVVLEVEAGGPAAKAGVAAGDAITAINGKAAGGLPVEKAVGLMRGRVGTLVTLTVDRQGKKGRLRTARLVRAALPRRTQGEGFSIIELPLKTLGAEVCPATREDCLYLGGDGLYCNYVCKPSR